MTRFIDGPAKDKALSLKRTPIFLRVTQSADGTWDALDQPEDTPRKDETVFAYMLKKFLGNCHIRASGGRSGFYAMAEYRVVEPQPDYQTMRKEPSWREWCEAHKTLYKE